ncbi:TPA: membrane protein insertion efficiency factor YidD [Vibrio alginolyticus]|nr:membrane protein insertion efficiency factor YidD [Vibrio alginolyticus]MBS9810453.1 membrane protein insertion efficiency factor YidD [Vibrio alginolyticus]MBT0114138.1 membrane protein insertion efficiency factor YidD [Vibrio alginolyticus]HCG5913240.1 membrane protein insertion efficiency factor YidD [Vibrio parahaemolyticus]HDU8600440.1 membrane protein insertion efficiency factor YidD [Vibrio alginolyticus]
MIHVCFFTTIITSYNDASFFFTNYSAFRVCDYKPTCSNYILIWINNMSRVF